MKQMIIEGNNILSGTIEIGGAKNSAVALIPASILARGKSTIENVPSISDRDALIDILNIYNDFDNMKIPNNKAIYLEKLIEDEDLNFVKGSKYVSNVVKKFNKVKSKNYEIPKDLNATLRYYQVSGFEFFKTLSDYEFGGILADEMGLGKTIQTIAFLLSNKDKKSIVITPTALIYNWKNELEKSII